MMAQFLLPFVLEKSKCVSWYRPPRLLLVMPFSRFMGFSNSVLLFHIHYPGSGNGVLDTASLPPSDLILSILPSRSFPQVLPPPSGTYPESLQGTEDVGAGQSFTNNSWFPFRVSHCVLLLSGVFPRLPLFLFSSVVCPQNLFRDSLVFS